MKNIKSIISVLVMTIMLSNVFISTAQASNVKNNNNSNKSQIESYDFASIDPDVDKEG